MSTLSLVPHLQRLQILAVTADNDLVSPPRRERNHKNGQIECLFHLGYVHQQQGDSATAYARFEEMLAVFRAYGADVSAALALLGDAAADLGRWEEAAIRCAES